MGKGDDHDRLFPLPEKKRKVKIETVRERIWTQNKALLIERYLLYFLKVTKHGTYVDAFAGPHEEHLAGDPTASSWAAGRVIRSQPSIDSNRVRLRHFHLFEKKRKHRKVLVDLQRERPDCDVRINCPCDFNVAVDELLVPEVLPIKEATFCLLDQYSFECHWQAVEKLARYQAEAGYKMEIFYFLANWWFNRARGRLGDRKGTAWWGGTDWNDFMQLPGGHERSETMKARFSDLGYESVMSWPIFTSGTSDSVAYYMIHATDHPRAPVLMRSAYEDAVRAPRTDAQLAMVLEVPVTELED